MAYLAIITQKDLDVAIESNGKSIVCSECSSCVRERTTKGQIVCQTFLLRLCYLQSVLGRLKDSGVSLAIPQEEKTL